MSKIAFLFPGQGSQAVGMGKAFAEQYPVARQTFEEADQVLGFPLSKLCFEGPEDALKLTENTQPALVAVAVAAYRILKEQGYRPDYVAGHSLGEYSALVAAGSLQFADALKLVRRRGRLMQQAVPPGVGAMAALLKLPVEALDGILEKAAENEVVTAANYNSPDQVVIAGHAGAVQRAMDLAKQAGAKRAILLPVSAPFHCPLMKPAQDQLWPSLQAVDFKDLQIPLINNCQAALIRSGEEARIGLRDQIPHSVRWTESMQRLGTEGVTRFVEPGVGAVLCGLMKSIQPETRCAKFSDPADLEKVTALLVSTGPVQ